MPHREYRNHKLSVGVPCRITVNDMPIPDFQSLFIPMLRRASDGIEHTMSDLREGIAAELKLTPDELSQKLPSGTQTVFANRVAWSTVHLAKAGALERVKRGVFKITARGRELLALNLPKLTIQNLSKYPSFKRSTRENEPVGRRSQMGMRRGPALPKSS
jgi:restriction system protein